jgi:hypothetical protein
MQVDENYLYIAAALGFITIICVVLFYFKGTIINTTNDNKSVSFKTEETEETEETDDNLNCDGEKCPFVPQKKNRVPNCDGEKCVLI